jgi:hypothetical protein
MSTIPTQSEPQVRINRDPVWPMDYRQINNHKFHFSLIQDGRVLFTRVMCKDYFQDVFWSEIRKEATTVCGLVWEPGRLRLADTYTILLEWEEGSLANHAPILEKWLNIWDNAIGAPPTKVEELDGRSILVTFAKDWVDTCPLLSTFTTLIRLGGGYKGGDPTAFIESLPANWWFGPGLPDGFPAYSAVEVQRIGVNRPKLRALLAGNKPTKPWDAITSGTAAHSTGIYGDLTYPVIKDFIGPPAPPAEGGK